MVLALAMALVAISGEWIGGGATAFEKDFTGGEGVASATLTVTGLGYYEAQIDGWKIGEKVWLPPSHASSTSPFVLKDCR